MLASYDDNGGCQYISVKEKTAGSCEAGGGSRGAGRRSGSAGGDAAPLALRLALPAQAVGSERQAEEAGEERSLVASGEAVRDAEQAGSDERSDQFVQGTTPVIEVGAGMLQLSHWLL